MYLKIYIYSGYSFDFQFQTLNWKKETNKRTIKQTNKQTNNERTNERMNEQTRLKEEWICEWYLLDDPPSIWKYCIDFVHLWLTVNHFNHAEVLASVDYLKSLIGPIVHGVLAWPSSTIVSAVVLELDFSLKAPRALHDKVLKCEDFIVWLESNTFM